MLLLPIQNMILKNWGLGLGQNLVARVLSHFNTDAHVPTPRYSQYLTHARNQIIPAVAAMDTV